MCHVVGLVCQSLDMYPYACGFTLSRYSAELAAAATLGLRTWSRVGSTHVIARAFQG